MPARCCAAVSSDLSSAQMVVHSEMALARIASSLPVQATQPPRLGLSNPLSWCSMKSLGARPALPHPLQIYSIRRPNGAPSVLLFLRTYNSGSSLCQCLGHWLKISASRAKCRSMAAFANLRRASHSANSVRLPMLLNSLLVTSPGCASLRCCHLIFLQVFVVLSSNCALEKANSQRGHCHATSARGTASDIVNSPRRRAVGNSDSVSTKPRWCCRRCAFLLLRNATRCVLELPSYGAEAQ